MKIAVELQQFKKCIILFMVGIACSLIGYVIYVIDPVKRIVDYELQLSPHSIAFSIWKKPPIDVFIKIYIFNITNPTEFLNGNEKLKVQEIGPYVYQEILENGNITWHDNGTLTYIPKRTVFFIPEKSVGNPKKDLITVPNIPMLGISSALSKASFFVNYPFTQLANFLDSKPLLNMPVHDYLWGYEDPLVRLASGIVPNYINFRKFGLLDRMYDEGDNIVNMNIKNNEDMLNEQGRYLSIESYNYSPGLANWGYRSEEGNVTNPNNTICNRIKGATEGTLFPPNLDKNAIFRVFRKAFCRTLPIVYKDEIITDSGLRGYLYQLADNFLDPPSQNPDNECYCRKMDRCLKKGLSDLTPCYYNIPAAVSLPHFLDADPSLLENVDGLKPDREKHSTNIILQPDIGIPMKVNSRMQTNLIMQRTLYNSRITPFNDMTIPLFWSDLYIPSINSDVMFLVKLSVQVMPVVQTVIIYLLTIVGITTIVLSLAGTLWVVNQQQQRVEQERRDSTDFRIPLDNGQYTAIRILPSAIKKITSRTSLFN